MVGDCDPLPHRVGVCRFELIADCDAPSRNRPEEVHGIGLSVDQSHLAIAGQERSLRGLKAKRQTVEAPSRAGEPGGYASDASGCVGDLHR